MDYKKTLTIAGSDPSGGAGIQADIKTMSSLGCYAASAITAVVDENTCGVTGVMPVPPAFVKGQIKSGNVEAARTGISRIKKRAEGQKHGHTCN